MSDENQKDSPQGNVLIKLNKLCQDFLPLSQTIGIASAVVVLLLTFYSTLLSHDSVKLLLEQEANKQQPIWDWAIIDSTSVVQLKPFNPDIKIQLADAYFTKEVFVNEQNWPLNQPDYKLHLTMFKFYMAEEFKKVHEYDPNFRTVSDRNYFPFGLEINYIQYGTSRIIKGIFLIQFTVVRTEEEPTIFINGVLFDRYLEPNDKLNKKVEQLYQEMTLANSR